MKNVVVYLDGRQLHADPPGFESWMRRRHVSIPSLQPGVHTLALYVRAGDSHPAALAYCEALDIHTDTTWDVTLDGRIFRPTMFARSPHAPELPPSLVSAPVALGRIAPWIALVFAVVAGWTIAHGRRGFPVPRPGTVRWLLIGAWAILAANNILKLPADVGMDVYGHLAYIRQVAESGRIPLATDGWQMFQSPLYYLVSAPLYSILDSLEPDRIAQWLRIIPLLCGMVLVELGYRTARHVFPGRADLQIIGTTLSACLPVNLYMSQVVGNEPMAAVLCSLAIVLVLRHDHRDRSFLEPRFAGLLGAVLGLALLAKASPVLLVIALAGFCLWRTFERERLARQPSRTKRILVGAACFGGALLLLAGWYYIRNWVLLGRPFVGGWDTARGITWWQDHGYVTPASLLTFGTALTRPILAQAAGFWDGMYGTFWLDGSMQSMVQVDYWPRWNLDFMLASALLALIPTAAMVLGFLRGIREPVILFCAGAIALYVGAILFLHVSSLPIYSTIKASYLLGLMPCFVILTARGFAALPRNPWLRSAAYGLFACWAVSAFSGYFILGS